MTTGFVMEAKENYDAASVALLNGDTQSAAFSLDPSNIACGYDHINRTITYLGCVIPGVDPVNANFENTTGFTLFDGYRFAYADSAFIDVPAYTATSATNFSPQVARKDIDSGAVTFSATYDATATVPAEAGSVYPAITFGGSGYTHAAVTVSGGSGTGMQVVPILDAGGGGYIVNCHVTDWGTGYGSGGGVTFTVTGDGSGATIASAFERTPSDGSWRWIGANFGTSARHMNGPGLVNPRNFDFWTGSASCELYQYRAADNYAQTLGPALMALNSDPFHTPQLIPVGIDATWCYCLTSPQNNGGFNRNLDLILVPAAVQSDETAAAAKLTYVIWDNQPFNPDYGARLTFGTDGNAYVFSVGDDGSGSHNWYWRLCKFVPPALGAFGTNAPGTLTDITDSLWGSGGPNADATNYSAWGFFGRFSPPTVCGSQAFSLVRLPATNQLAAVLKMYKEASQTDPTDYDNTNFACVYVTLGASPSYDYHSGFVTGYMDATWAPSLSIPTTGWAVIDARETNNYLEQSDHIYDGVDYTKRWFVFQCYPIAGGVVDTSNGLMDVIVEYKFVSGAPPAVVSSPRTLTDPDWSSNYPAYASAISQTNLVYNSTFLGTAAQQSSNFQSVYIYPDPGLYDDATKAFWFSGITDPYVTADTLAANAMFHLDSAFTARAADNESGQPNNTFGPISPPFLRLTVPGLSFANSFVRSFVGNPQL